MENKMRLETEIANLTKVVDSKSKQSSQKANKINDCK